MSARPLRIATTSQLERSAREAGFDVYHLPDEVNLDFHRPLEQRLRDGEIVRPFLEKHDIDLVLDFNTSALTLSPTPGGDGQVALTTATLGISYVACYLDPVTSTMSQVPWPHHWSLLESVSWIKWMFEPAHTDELIRMGIPNMISMPIAAANDDFDTGALPKPDASPLISFMGHPASSWFGSQQPILPAHLLPAMTAAAVRSDMPDVPFLNVYYDLYEFAEPVQPGDDDATRARKSQDYFSAKFAYNAYLAVKQRDRWARFLKLKLGDAFELIGDFWGDHYKLKHTPRIWDAKKLHERMRRVPICLNLMKGNVETGLIYRHFEITAYGGFMLTYPSAQLEQCFKIGEECDVFHSEEELLQKISYYIEHPKRRAEIARAGQERTLREHLYSHRITKLVELLRESGSLPNRNGGAAVAAAAQTGCPGHTAPQAAS